MKNLAVFSALLLFCAPMFAQTLTPAPERLIDFTASPNGNGYQFTAAPPPLQQKAGAPAAFWTYYWEFGDGRFSFENEPLHTYEKPGDYTPILCATAHYDDGGKPPKQKPKKLLADRAGEKSADFPTVFDSVRIPIQMKANRQARANEELVCILSYRNLGQVRTDGRLHVFFNERSFKTKHFALDSARTYFGERVDNSFSQVLPTVTTGYEGWTVLNLPSHTGVSTSLSGDLPNSIILQQLLDNARGKYREEKQWRFDQLMPGEKRNVFLAMRGTDKMLQDTNAFIHLEAVFAPFDPVVPPDRFELEIEIVSSHDPNAIIVSDSRVNYRLIGSKKLDYKVQFQNNGEGPASTVELKIEIPEGLDMKQMRPLEWYPKCAICPETPSSKSCLDTASSKEGLLFTFRNIYLPGSRQKDVEDRDSTKGFVRYRMDAARDMPKTPFRSRAKITFDKNPPIYTNYTRTRFSIGLSPGLKVGYGFEPNTGGESTNPGNDSGQSFVQNGYVFLGASLSPYKSWRVYPQVELLSGIKGQETGPEVETNVVDTIFHNIDIDTLSFKRIKRQDATGYFSFELPVMLRKNFSRFFGAGLGGSCRVLVENTKTISQTQERVMVQILGQPPKPVSDTIYPSVESSTRNTKFRYTAFADLSFGSVRKGINLGIRGGVQLGKGTVATPFVQLSLEMKL